MALPFLAHGGGNVDSPASARTVLICDDDLIVRQLASSVLESDGYRCLQAGSEDEAFALFEKQPVDVMLMDIYLGESNGIDCVRRIRETPRGAETPVVFITSSMESTDIQACLGEDIDACAYLNKPIVWETLPALCSALAAASEIRYRVQRSESFEQKQQVLLEGLANVRQMLGHVVTSEERRAAQAQGSFNPAVLLHLNVAHQALEDIEQGFANLLAPVEPDSSG
ncbi:MAG: response regulator [Pseudomonadota bacterium]